MTDAGAPVVSAAQQRRVLLSFRIIIVAMAIAATGNVGLAMFADVWQLHAIIVMLLAMIVGYRWFFTPRALAGDVAGAVRQSHRTMMAAVVFTTTMMAGSALALALTIFIMALATMPGVLSFREVNRVMLTTTMLAIVLLAVDLFEPAVQARFPLFQVWLYIMTSTAMLALVVLVVRDFQQYPLTTKLQVAFLFVALGGVGLHSYLSGLNLRHDLETETAAGLQRAADAGAALVEAQLADLRALAVDDARALAGALGTAPTADERAAAAIAALLQRERLPVLGAALVGRDGRPLAQRGQVTVDPTTGPADSAVDSAVNSGTASGPPTDVRAVLRGGAVEVVVPVSGPDGRPLATLHARYPIAAMRAGFERLSGVAGPDIAMLLLGAGDLPQLIAGQRADERSDAAPIALLERRSELPGAQLQVVARADMTALSAPLAARDRFGKLVGMLVAALVTVVAFGVGNVLSRPVVGLTAAVVRMRGGDLSARAPVRTGDEIGELTRAFNDMADQLGELFAGLNNRSAELQVEVATRQERERQLQRLNEELSAARDRALEASRVKSTFLANMSHELRTPLNAIIGYTELLRDDAAASGQVEVARDLTKIHGAGTHLLAVISDILDLSKIEAGRMDTHIEVVDFAELVGEVLTALTPLAGKSGNSFVAAVAPEVGDIHTDRTKLRQILYNLLSNATKFSERGQIELRAERTVDPVTGTDTLRFVVADPGIGIAPEKLATLFEPFVQADDSTTRRFGGTGLGLAITRRFCRMLGGDITATSTAGVGSQFIVHIPIHRPVAPLVAAAEWQDPHGPHQPQGRVADARTTTVLVVDDELVVHELMGRFLAREGYRVLSARTGAQALQLAREAAPDVITLDVLMPGMDGWTVLAALKSDPQLAEVPVVVMTIVSDREVGFSLGAADYLLKPIDRERLLGTLARYRKPNTSASVLVVDDAPDIRELLCRLAERAHWSVREAANGREALEALREGLPDVVLLDLMMPEVDGFEVIQTMRADPTWRAIPVIVITACELTSEELAFLQAGVHRILRKGSYSQAALLAEVRTLVETTAVPTHPREA